MKKYTNKKINEILENHTAWLRNKDSGECANLSGAYLSCANLSGANLIHVDTTQTSGLKVIALQVNVTRFYESISYYLDWDTITVDGFQGTMKEFKNKISKDYKDNEFLRNRYERAIKFIEAEAEFEKGGE